MSKMSKKAPTMVLNTLAVTAAAATVVALSGCSEPADTLSVKVYDTPEACVRDGKSVSECKDADSMARVAHTLTAPKYAEQKDCEEDWGSGKCEAAQPPQSSFNENGMNSASTTTHHGGGGVVVYPHSYYSPYYQGYMMGNYRDGRAYPAQPVYRSVSGEHFTANGAGVAHGGKVSAGEMAAGGKSASFAKGSSFGKGGGTSVARGGFGSAGRAGGVSMGG